MIGVALVLGVLLGLTTGIADRIFGGPNPKTIASASLESMRAQNRLIAFVARYVSVVTQRAAAARRSYQLGADARSCPATCATNSTCPSSQPKDVSWDGSTHTLRVQLPEIEIAGPDVDLAAAQEYGDGGVLSALTNANQQLDQANRARAVADLRKQAHGGGADAARAPGGARRQSSGASRCR